MANSALHHALDLLLCLLIVVIRYVLDIMGDSVRTEAQFDTQDGLYDCAWSEENENHM